MPSESSARKLFKGWGCALCIGVKPQRQQEMFPEKNTHTLTLVCLHTLLIFPGLWD